MNNFIRYFGGSKDTLTEVKSKYTNLSFLELNQIHGDKLVSASENKPDADAHWTDQLNLALIIKTADCIPLLVTHPEFICAIHAGWRGVVNEITYKSLNTLISQFSFKEKIEIYFGPHIQLESFEISIDLFSQFENLAKKYNVKNYFKTSPSNSEKLHIDLSTLVQAQLISLGITPTNINTSPIDTMTSTYYCSHRRSTQQNSLSHTTAAHSTGRNYSFVARL